MRNIFKNPDRGDIVWLTFNPQLGNEHTGRRPALVLSPLSYNLKIGLAVFCPITSKIKGYPFEVKLPTGTPVSGAILADQVKSLDWRARKAKLICILPKPTLLEVLDKISTLITI